MCVVCCHFICKNSHVWWCLLAIEKEVLPWILEFHFFVQEIPVNCPQEPLFGDAVFWQEFFGSCPWVLHHESMTAFNHVIEHYWNLCAIFFIFWMFFIIKKYRYRWWWNDVVGGLKILETICGSYLVQIISILERNSWFKKYLSKNLGRKTQLLS